MSSVSTSSSPTPNSLIVNQNSAAAAVAVAEKLRDMALVPNPALNEAPLFAEVDMGADASAATVRATVVQAATVFYDTPATLGVWIFSFVKDFSFFKETRRITEYLLSGKWKIPTLFSGLICAKIF